MATRRRYWLVLSVAALSGTVGCSSGSYNLWPSGWFGSKPTPPAGLAQYSARNTPPANPSRSGANAQLGAPASESAGPFAAISASFKKWTSGDAPETPVDALSLDSHPKQLSPELHTQIARMHEAKGDFATAIKQYEQALETSPDNTDVLVGLARCYDRKGDMQKAIETYRRAIRVDARCALAYNDLGLCYARQHNLAAAREHLNKAVALVPTSKLYRNNLATVLVDAKQYNEAYEQLAAVHPPAIAQYNLGILANRRGDKGEATRRFQEAATIDPNLAQARHMLDKLNGTAGHAASVAQHAPSAGQVQDQARQYQANLQDQARQYQTGAQEQVKQYQSQWRDQARQLQADWKNQVQTQVDQTKTQVEQTQAQVAEQVQSQVSNVEQQVNQGVTQGSAAAQTAIRDAEAKIRAALQPQVAPVEPSYGSGWVPPQEDDITPIPPETEYESTGEESHYTITDDDELPVLLPPTGE